MSKPTKEPLFSTLQLGMGWFSEDPGGLNRVYYNLLQHLPQFGIETQGLVAGTSRVLYESNGQVETLGPASDPLLLRWWRARRAVRGALARNQFSLVVSHFALYTFPVLDLIRPHPLVIHFQGPWALEGMRRGLSTKAKGTIERVVYRCGTRFIVLSCAFRDVLHRNYGVPVERIRVIPGGIDVNRFACDFTRREARERLGWPHDRPILLTVRRLVQRMGLDDLTVAMKEVCKRLPEVLLLVVGEGPLAEELSARVQALGLKNNVRLLGFVPDQDLPTAYRAADLTIVPSEAFEGFGLVVLESLAAGTPALVTPVGGLPEVVRDLSPGLVLPAAGANSLSEGIVMALTGGLVLPSTEACQTYVQERYDWPMITARVRDVYLEALR